MRAIYIGSGPKNKSTGGLKWKLYMFLFVFLALTVSVLKVAGPTLVEKWINEKGADSKGFAFSIRDTEISLSRGQVVLNDVKIFNPITNTEILEAPQMSLQFNWSELLTSSEKKVTVSADQVDLILSKDFTSEISRIREMKNKKNDLYLDVVEGKIGKLNVIEQKEDQSRTVVELKDVNLKVKEFTPLSINKKSEFSVSSNLADGGKLNLSGKTSEVNGRTPWTIQGSLKKVPSDILNKFAGDKLPFSFMEPTLTAEIKAHSDQGKVSGEISPEIRKLNLIEERPGIPTQTIARMLTDELTFSLPFTLKDSLSFQYAETFAKLKNYRKYAGSPVTSPGAPAVPASQPAKLKKTSSFWPF